MFYRVSLKLFTFHVFLILMGLNLGIQAQVSVSDTTLCAGDTVYFSYECLTCDSILWNFGNGDSSKNEASPLPYTYNRPGNFKVFVVTYQEGAADTFYTESSFITVEYANAEFIVSDSLLDCYPREVIFSRVNDNAGEVLLWDFGFENNTSVNGGIQRFTYTAPGNYPVSLQVETPFGCFDEHEKQIQVSGPQASFSMTPDSACKGDEITFTLVDSTDLFAFEWEFEDGVVKTGSPVTHHFQKMGTKYPKLIIYGNSGLCIPPPLIDTLHIFSLDAGFEVSNTSMCDGEEIFFQNKSIGQTENTWIFDNDEMLNDIHPVKAFDPGTYQVGLIVQNEFGCKDTVFRDIQVDPLPEIIVHRDTLICRGDEIMIWAYGGHEIEWSPEEGVDDQYAYETLVSPSLNITYDATILDTITGCSNQDDIEVKVLQEPGVKIYPFPDTTIIVGEKIHVICESEDSVHYAWSPDQLISCLQCANPVMQPLQDIVYTLEITDTLNCFTIPYNISIDVVEEYTVDVPTAFTPNGDQINDVVHVKGWGIKNLLEFRIFNRWGNEIFYTDDISIGWDGSFEGKIQNMGTYVYFVRAEAYDGRIITKKGTINLLQ